ncbi:MAG: dihydroorotate dehydrogenase (quinone) [Chloroflexi bacterium]|nr:dihydroorotate dehydrogenase (quinone) [Chloroflexota bacterium]
MFYKFFILPILQRINPEVSHFIVEIILQCPFFRNFNPIHYIKKPINLSIKILGIEFNSPIGLAAGFDKNCKNLYSLLSLGFGFITGGTITFSKRDGNPKPRLFHLKKSKALVNSMGFPGDGLQKISDRLKHYNSKSENVFLSVSGTIKKDIIDCIKTLRNHCKAFEINISSPNTEGLKIFHDEEKLSNLIFEAKKVTTKPIFIKLPPWDKNNKNEGDYLSIAYTSIKSGAEGLIVANSRPYAFDKLAVGKGGLSGDPLKNDTIRMVSEVRNKIGSKPIIIACGGISDEIDVWNCIAAGANLCQAYTAFIYNGPSFAYNINKKLSALMIDKNVESLEKIQGQSIIKR